MFGASSELASVMKFGFKLTLFSICFFISLLWPPYVIGQAIIFCPVVFFYLLFFLD